MKKNIFLIIILSVMMCFSSCNTNVATEFSSVPIDNSFNNLKIGGRMAYFDNELYLVYVSDIVDMGWYKMSSAGVENLLNQNKMGSILDSVRFCSYDNKLYSVNFDCDVKEYDADSKNFNPVDFLNDNKGKYFYLSADLVVYYSKHNKLTVKYKDNKYTIKDKVYDFSVSNNILYYFGEYNTLMMNDTTKENPESIELTQISGSTPNLLQVCDKYCYFISDLNQEHSVLYRYSIENNELEVVMNEEVISYNSYDKKIYCATTEGIYVSDINGNFKKISNKKTEEIYIFDEDWIYINNNKGKYYRMTTNGENVERIDFNFK